MRPAAWDVSKDVVAVGAGGAGLLAAVYAKMKGLDVLLLEKTNLVGGTTALSGGVIWVPNNHLMRRLGLGDSEEEALTYLKNVLGNEYDESTAKNYIQKSNEMLKFITEEAGVNYQVFQDYPDYYAHLPGGKLGGRALEPSVFDGRKLGQWLHKIVEPPPFTKVLGKIMITGMEGRRILVDGELSIVLKEFAKHYLDIPSRIRYRKTTRLTLGVSLVAQLLKAALENKVEIKLNSRIRKLITVDGRVEGVEAEIDGKSVRVRARRGVLLTSGGFSKNMNFLVEMLGEPVNPGWSAAVESDTGDCLEMAWEVGALKGRSSTWWFPVTRVEGEKMPRILILERQLPHAIMVNRFGERFCNEAAPYTDLGPILRTKKNEEFPNVPAFLIIDSHYRRNYPFGALMPSKFVPEFFAARLVKRAVVKSSNLKDLAERLGINADKLQATLEEFNEMALKGKDEKFGKGDYPYDRFFGDRKTKPNPCLAPVDKPPFYAMPVYPGMLGTKGGLEVDLRARVLNQERKPIDGLYAAGNIVWQPFGNKYPGTGSTIGPALTYAFIAAHEMTKG